MSVLARNNVTATGGPNPPIVYAHGFGCDKTMWDLILPAFDQTNNQITFDYVGCGQSDLRAFHKQRYSTIEGYAQDIIDVCDALNLHEGVIFVGHSVSCSAGIRASIIRPQLFRRLILIGPTPCFLNNPPEYCGGFDIGQLEELLAMMEQNYLGWANQLVPLVSGDTGDLVSNRLRESFCSTDPLTAKTFARTTFLADDRSAYALTRVPSLVLHHKADLLVPISVAEFLRNTLVSCTFRVLDVGGHCAHLSHPHLVINEMKQYLASA